MESESTAAPVSPCLSTTRILIVYMSKYGSTRQYALWLREAIPGDLAELGQGEPDLTHYDLVIVGSYIRKGEIAASSFLEENRQVLKDRQVILFTVSGTPPGHPALEASYNRSIPADMRSGITHYALPGRLIREDLTLFDRILLSFGKTFEKDEIIRRTMEKDYDHVRRKHLQPLISSIREIMQSRCDRNPSGPYDKPGRTNP
jgi:menaquinone-dependent protoporphyrinogen IX oxidase